MEEHTVGRLRRELQALMDERTAIADARVELDGAEAALREKKEHLDALAAEYEGQVADIANRRESLAEREAEVQNRLGIIRDQLKTEREIVRLDRRNEDIEFDDLASDLNDFDDTPRKPAPKLRKKRHHT